MGDKLFQPKLHGNAFGYGYRAGSSDRHLAIWGDEKAMGGEPNGLRRWWRGWRKGYKERRQDLGNEAMLYAPPYPAGALRRLIRGTPRPRQKRVKDK